MIFGYARVSKKDQNLELQIDALEKYGVEEIYQEKITGTKTDRPELEQLLKVLRKGDKIVVYKLDRISRSTKHLIELAEFFEKKEIDFISIQDNIDTSSPIGRFFFRMIASIAELERDIIRERTIDGLAAARARGKKGGRPFTDKKTKEKALNMYKSKQFTLKEIKDMTGVAPSTIYSWLKQESTQTDTAKIRMWLRIENNNKFVRSKGKVRESIEHFLKDNYKMEIIANEYIIYVPYTTVDELEKTVYNILSELNSEADMRNCFIEADVYCDELGLTW
ncbi:recombinase family protein [Ectobacillus panaciterrae]|uniref:recombinase family protein n=1 Tax=Ectobacillus panaciterrae TaxID=363872 RepID=UPI00042A65FE|nr:recombinase family protein [Ectobacillus panaciterrae]